MASHNYAPEDPASDSAAIASRQCYLPTIEEVTTSIMTARLANIEPTYYINSGLLAQV